MRAVKIVIFGVAQAFERIDDPEAPPSDELRQEIIELVAWADETTPSVYERQPIINALGNVLYDARMDDVARPLLTAGMIHPSSSP